MLALGGDNNNMTSPMIVPYHSLLGAQHYSMRKGDRRRFTDAKMGEIELIMDEIGEW